MYKNLNIAICVPSAGEWKSEFGKSLAMLFSYFADKRVGGCKSQRLQLFTSEGSMLVQLRHSLVAAAMKEGCTHVLFLDSDMKFPRNLLHRFLASEKRVIGANCTTRVEPVVSTAHSLEGPKIDSRGKEGLQEVSRVGTAVMLIDSAVFKKLHPPLFMMEWIPDSQAYCGEDVYFCAKLSEVGEKVYIDHEVSVQVEHCGNKTYGHSMITEKENAKV